MFRTLTPILSVLAALGIFFLYVQPLYGEIRLVQDETEEYAQAVEQANQFNNLLSELIAQKNSFSALDMERLETFVPDTLDVVGLLVEIENLATLHKLSVGTIDVSGEAESSVVSNADSSELESAQISNHIGFSDFETTEVSFSVIGGYLEMREFLASMEESLVLMDIINFSFGVSDGDLLEYDITLRLYALTPTV